MTLYEPALRYFLAVYETGSVNAAARRLFVAGSAVSRQVARLEKEVGAPLFDRLPTGVVPTEAGHAFAGFARRVIQDAEQLVDEIHERRSADTLISLAASSGIGHEFLPRVAGDYRVAHRSVRFELHITDPLGATHLVRDGAADVAVTFNIAIERGVRIAYSTPAPLRAVVRAEHELAGRASVSLAELLPYPLVLNPLRTTNRQLVDVLSAAQGTPIEPVLVCDNPGAMVRFIGRSDAVGLIGMISIATHVAGGEIVAIRLRDKELRQRTLQVQTQAGRRLPAAVQEFVDELVAALETTEV
ncbi:MAG: LysR family transcriptional regulator [Pseudonocardia sp.]|nr:LysR family transcriptional regulator [Pseudonocardia sp.]